MGLVLSPGASLKHFAVNSQELSRFNSDSILDERTLRELYLTAFEIAVKEGRPLRPSQAERQALQRSQGAANGHSARRMGL